ncbi:3186_t:CDS:1, partial [Racocetra fulgida]
MKLYQAKRSYQWAYESYEKATTLIHTMFERTSYYQLQHIEFYLDAFDTWANYDKHEEGKQKLLKIIDIITKQYGERHRNLAKAYCRLSIFDLVQKEYESAEKKLLQAYDLYEQLPKIYIDHSTTLIKLE